MGNSLRNISAIAGKELRSYFGSPVAWVLMGFFAIIFARFFLVSLVYFVQQSMGGQFGAPPPTNVNNDMIRPLLQNASVLLLFMLPMITMRTFSEEKRAGTIELLLTSPVTDAEIMFGKFFGAVGASIGFLAVTFLYVAIMFTLGTPAVRPILSGYLGLLLLASSFIAMGLFISSTTKNQVVAAGVTFAVLLLFWILDWSADRTGGMLGEVLTYLSVTRHFEDFARGVVDTKHVVYYLSFIAFGLFLTLKSVDSERWRG